MTAAITGKQVRAARRLLGWDRTALAVRANVNPTLLIKLEMGSPLSDEPIQAVQRALEVAGVEFLADDEVQLHDVVKDPWE